MSPTRSFTGIVPPIFREAVAYTIMGAAGTALHYLVFLLLIGPIQSPVARTVLASTVGAVLGAVTNYLLTRRWAFWTHRPHRQAAPRFALAAVLALIVNSLTVGQLSVIGLMPLHAQLVASLAALATGFFINRKWTFT